MSFFDRFKRSPGESESPSAAEQPPAREATAEQPEGSSGLFARFKQGLRKTSQILNTDIRDLFKQEGRLIDDDFLREFFAVLIKTDMGAGPASEIRDRVARDFRGRVVHMEDLLAVVRKQLRELLAQPIEPIRFAETGPTVIMVVGVNGSGKTTSIAKLAYRFKQQGHHVVLGAADTFRAAAVEQLTIWAERIGVEIVKGAPKSDPASVAHQAVARAAEMGGGVCIVDTAGRLQTQTNLMKQLTKIRSVMSKLVPDAPHEVLLVLDATSGQNGISQAKGFSEAVQCTGLVLAKLDGTAKGGVVIPVRRHFELPVKFIGVGEQLDDLAVFEADRFVDALFSETATAR